MLERWEESPSWWLCLAGCSRGSPTGAPVDAPSADTSTADTATDAPTSSMMIGSAGGTVEADGATLVVPAGALAADVAITVTKTADLGPFGQSPSVSYLLAPEGQTFASPVTFTLHLAAPPGGGESIEWSKLGVANPAAAGDYELRPTTVTGNDVTASNTHFSHVFGARILVALD
jgi:hypothetical protein